MATKKSSVKKKHSTSYPIGMDKSWQARDDLRTLQQAKEIQGNKARIRAAEIEARAQVAAITSVIKK